MCIRDRCAAIGERDFYPGLAADLVSLPSPPWDTAHEESVVERMHCDEDLAIALCSGAPCYTDASRGDAPLNVSCLCPVYPFSGSKSFMLTPPDVGHTGGCAAYGFANGTCARQASSDALVGAALRRWSVDAFDTMRRVPRWTADTCRSWYGLSTKHSRHEGERESRKATRQGDAAAAVSTPAAAPAATRCLLYTSPSPRDRTRSRMPSSA